jgi:ribosomal protein S18 acetylase RimI-like enzyme
MIIRHLSQDELATFATVCGRTTHAHDVEEYLQRMFQQGAIHSEWCFVMQEAEQIIGTLAYWGLPSTQKPSDFVLLSLPWERTDFLTLGRSFLHDTLLEMRKTYDLQEIGHVLDLPPLKPQWQFFPEQRLALFEQIGFRLTRKTQRFEWQGETEPPRPPQRLHFRSLPEVGEQAFIKAIEHVSAGTFDQYIQEEREQHGPEKQAHDFFLDLQQMEHEPSWWQLAYTPQNELVGLTMPAKNPGSATIGYIGVVPQFRGRGYVNDLLIASTSILYQAGLTTIRADTDLSNEPMAQAFLRNGYTKFAQRYEFTLSLTPFLQQE